MVSGPSKSCRCHHFLVPYGIDFDGYDCTPVISRTTSVPPDPNAVCEVSSEAGDDVEVEPWGDANGGCNGTLPFQFENISAGVTFSGTSYSVIDPADPTVEKSVTPTGCSTTTQVVRSSTPDRRFPFKVWL